MFPAPEPVRVPAAIFLISPTEGEMAMALIFDGTGKDALFQVIPPSSESHIFRGDLLAESLVTAATTFTLSGATAAYQTVKFRCSAVDMLSYKYFPASSLQEIPPSVDLYNAFSPVVLFA